MDVTYITNSFAHDGGGLVGAVSGLGRAVSSSGAALGVVAYDSEGEAGAWGDLPLSVIQSKRFGGIHFFGDLSSILDAQSPELIHAHGLWLRSSQQNHWWCGGHDIPYLISPHGMLDPWAVKYSAWKKRLAGLWFEYKHLNGAACLHALCESEARSIRSFGQQNPITVIPNGIELPAFGVKMARPSWLSRERKALLFIGRLHPKKGLPLLLDAWARVKKANPRVVEGWFLAIAGWSEVGHQAELEEQVRELCLHGDVEFLGPLHGEFKASALCHASAFVLPSYSEGLPMSVLEAWSYQLPSLITPECNLPEGFDSDAAICIEADVDSIVAGLIEVFEMSDGQRAEMGQRAYRLVESKFTWPEIAKQMVEVYEWILGGGDAPSSVRFI